MPTKPVPSKPKVPGSGTVPPPPGPVVAKQVWGLLRVLPGHAGPMMWKPLMVMPVVMSALVKSRDNVVEFAPLPAVIQRAALPPRLALHG